MNRNTFVDGDWILKKVENYSICDSFDCGDDDLNEYFHEDVRLHKTELLTQTYVLQVSTDEKAVIALLDFCNDALQLNKVKHPVEVDSRIHYRSLPAVKLTRFGVMKKFQRKNIGTHALNMVKKLFLHENRTGCRFITVDANNKIEVIGFYKKNGFEPFTPKDENKETRSLYFDLKRLKVNSPT